MSDEERRNLEHLRKPIELPTEAPADLRQAAREALEEWERMREAEAKALARVRIR